LGAGDGINLANRYRQRTNTPKPEAPRIERVGINPYDGIPKPPKRYGKFKPSFVGRNPSQVAKNMRQVYSGNPNAIGRGKLNAATDLTPQQRAQLAQGFTNVKVRNRMGTPNAYRV
jgi:hypothetical protein